MRSWNGQCEELTPNRDIEGARIVEEVRSGAISKCSWTIVVDGKLTVDHAGLAEEWRKGIAIANRTRPSISQPA